MICIQLLSYNLCPGHRKLGLVETIIGLQVPTFSFQPLKLFYPGAVFSDFLDQRRDRSVSVNHRFRRFNLSVGPLRFVLLIYIHAKRQIKLTLEYHWSIHINKPCPELALILYEMRIEQLLGLLKNINRNELLKN